MKANRTTPKAETQETKTNAGRQTKKEREERKTMKEYKRKTRDRYDIVTRYGVECSEYTYKEARQTAKEYTENGYPARIEKHRERIEK